MNILQTTNKRIHESNLELYRARLAGKLCIAIVNLTQIISALMIVFKPPILAGLAEWFILISIPIRVVMIFIIILEFILFKKCGPKFAKYSNIVDITLLFLFTAEWSVTLIAAFYKMQFTNPPSFAITAIFGFTSFSWRTLLVTLIVQDWKLKIVPPAAASIISLAYVLHYSANNALALNLVRGFFQIFNIVIIIYCEDRIKWRMIWKNLQQEKWMQVNTFILNNIPENIMILDFRGETKFISDYCTAFMKKYGIAHHNSRDLFSNIRDLQQLQSEPELSKSSERILIERLTSRNELVADTSVNNTSTLRIEALEDLLANFRKIIEEKGLQERQFLVYNGKLKMENDLPDKSIEIKLSFLHHFESEYIVLILRDTTQRDLLVTLEETNKYKDQLLASVSHELRAPLNGNINLIEGAINSPDIPELIKESLLIPALRSGKFLLHIINDILDMSQIKQKKLRLVFESKDLKETLKSAAQLVELQAIKKGIKFTLEFDPKLPKIFCTDHMRLSQIVLNLLSNAIKFTKEGEVKLIIKPMDIINSGWIKIIVEDSGVGICPDNLQKILPSPDSEGQQTGAGLGLNIASNLVDLLCPKGHPGIRVASVLNQGSVFSFIIENKERLPTQCEEQSERLSSSFSSYEVADELPQTIIPLPRIQKNNTGFDSSTSMIFPLATKTNELENLVDAKCDCPKILIVDDNPFNVMAFETILNSLGIKSDSVYSGSGCIKKLLCRQNKACGKRCQSYSVVFMDQEMPEMTGNETVEEIRRLQGESSIPEMKVIGCTAHKAKEEVDRFMASGLDSCIFKPISVAMIKDVLKEILVTE